METKVKYCQLLQGLVSMEDWVISDRCLTTIFLGYWVFSSCGWVIHFKCFGLLGISLLERVALAKAKLIVWTRKGQWHGQMDSGGEKEVYTLFWLRYLGHVRLRRTTQVAQHNLNSKSPCCGLIWPTPTIHTATCSTDSLWSHVHPSTTYWPLHNIHRRNVTEAMFHWLWGKDHLFVAHGLSDLMKEKWKPELFMDRYGMGTRLPGCG